MVRFRKNREILGNRYTIIRNSVQLKKPFAIINFASEGIFKNFLYELDQIGSVQYIIQNIWNEKKKYPSIFLTNSESNLSTDDFRDIVIQLMKNHHIDSIVGLYKGAVGVYYRDGSGHEIGNEINSTLNSSDISGDYYQVEGRYYTFV